MKRPKHLATQLTTWYFTSSLLLVTVVAGFLYWSLVQTLRLESQRLLEGRLHTLHLLCAEKPFDLARLKQRVEIEWPSTIGGRYYVRIASTGAHVVAASPNMPDTALAALEAEATPTLATTLSAFWPFTEGDDFRIISQQLDSPLGPLDARIALDYSTELDFLRDYRTRVLWVLAGAFFVCALVAREVARRGVAPVKTIGEHVIRITSSRLHERLEWTGFPMELATLAKTFNEMLDRMQGAFTRQSQFSADIAHELKTPFANMAGEIEVTLSKEREALDYRDVLASCLEECYRLSRIVDSLLLLAKCDEGTSLNREVVDLRLELDHLVEFYEGEAADKQLSLTLSGPALLRLPLEKTLLHRAVGNLIANSVKQTPAGGAVAVSFREEQGSAVIEVKDNGCGIAAEHLALVFDRFYRVDSSRSQSSGGSGLGLAIVKSIAAVHGGTVSLASEVGVGTTVRLTMPIRPATPAGMPAGVIPSTVESIPAHRRADT